MITIHYFVRQKLFNQMGVSNSKLLSQQTQLLKNFTIDSRNPQENLTYLTSKSTGHHYLLREIIFNEESEYQNMIKKIEQRKMIKSKYITQLQRIEFFKDEGICSKFYRIFTLWEFPRRTLTEDINERALLKLPFSLLELKNLLIQIVYGLSSYEEQRINYQCLTTKTILLTEQSNAKIVDSLALPLRPNVEVVFNKRSTKNVYLSPEQCNIIESQQLSTIPKQPFESDLFIAAMILVQCALLERQDDCYLNDYESINWTKLDKKIQLIQAKYGKEFSSILSSVLTQTSFQRIDSHTMIERLKGLQIGQQIQMKDLSIKPIAIKPYAPTQLVFSHQQIKQPAQRKSFTFTYRRPIEQRAYQQRPQQMQVKQTALLSMRHDKPPMMPKANKPKLVPYPQITFNHSNINNLNHPIHNPNNQTIIYAPIEQIKHDKNDQNTLQTVNNQTNAHQSKLNANQTHHQPHRAVFLIDRYAQQKRYEGFKVNGKKQGKGNFYFGNKLCFQGNWKDDMMEGEGKMYYESGILAYDGNFKEDRFHGYGRLYNECPQMLQSSFDFQDFDSIENYWKVYEGYFQDDLREGKGTLYLTNGQIFEGRFHCDNIEGEGTFTTKEGVQIHGIWESNVLQRIID